MNRLTSVILLFFLFFLCCVARINAQGLGYYYGVGNALLVNPNNVTEQADFKDYTSLRKTLDAMFVYNPTQGFITRKQAFVLIPNLISPELMRQLKEKIKAVYPQAILEEISIEDLNHEVVMQQQQSIKAHKN